MTPDSSRMIAVCLAATAVAVWCWLRPPATGVRMTPGARASPNRRRPPLIIVLTLAAGAGAVVCAGLLAGSSGMAVATSAALVLATSASVIARGRRRREATRVRREIAHGCRVLARLATVGQIPAAALDVAAEDCPVLREAAAVQRLGGDPAELWFAASTRPGHDGLRTLARAWTIGHTSGATLARPLADAAAAITAREEIDRVTMSELAAPRATGRMLGVLPLAGVGLGFVIGGDPVSFLISQPVGEVCLVAGIALACAGVVWMERLSGGRAP